MRFSTRSRLGLFLLLFLVLASGLGLYTSSRGAAQAAGPRVWLSQKIGPPTASMQLHGKGFGLNETVLVDFDDTTQIGSTTTDATGQFIVQVAVPKTALPGTHSVRAMGQSSGLTSLALFLVRADWSQPGFGPYHTGHNPYENVLSPSNVSGLTLDWSNPNVFTSPVVAGGMVYAGSSVGSYNPNRLDALDAVTGTLKWSYTIVRGFQTSPAVANGVVYVGSYVGTLYALDAVTGTLKWSYTTGGKILYSSPTIANGLVYVCSYDDKLYAVDATTGTLKWSSLVGACWADTPAVAGGVVYACGGNGANGLTALDAATGTLKWSIPVSCGLFSAPAVVNGVVYVGGGSCCPQNSGLYALDAATGTLKWSYIAGNSLSSFPLAVANGVVYFGPDGISSELYALDATTGTLKWSYATGNSSLAVANGVVYDCANGLTALDAASGTLKWSSPAGGFYDCSLAVVNGVVYVLGGVGNVSGLLAFHLPGMS